jgi:hypothetical protein
MLNRLAFDTARNSDLLILDGSLGLTSGSHELLATALIARRRRAPPVILTECNWKAGSGVARMIRQAGIRAIDGAVARYCVYTSAELVDFPRRWGVEPAKMVFTPCYFNVTDEEAGPAPAAGGHILSVGNSLRDYDTLVAAAHGVDFPFRIASDRALQAAHPPNVRIGRIRHGEYEELIRSAAVVVVPLRPGIVRAAGLETLLTAMAIGKLVIASEAPGIRDYIDDGRTGLIVPPGDSRALRDAIGWAVDPANAESVAEMASAGRSAARSRFSPERYVRTLLRIADEVLGTRPAPEGSGGSGAGEPVSEQGGARR